MPDWLPGLVLPNIYLQEPVEAGIAAFAAYEDKRVIKSCEDDEPFASFLNRFTDAFKTKLRPSVLLITSRISMPMAATLRDALSMSVVPYSHARMLIWGRTMEFPYSDWFDFYPWMPNNNNGDGGMTAFTPALTAFHVVKDFHGQCSPLISPQSLSPSNIDKVLFEELVRRWLKRFSSDTPEWSDIALFRSLDMANAAAKIPAGRDATEYSFGRSVANWISAIEILIHPEDGNVDYRKVYHHLDSVKWEDEQLKKNDHDAYPRKGGPPRSLPCWIYGELLHARNDFMHGNAVDADRLKVASGRYLHHFAAPLYRMVLTGFLGLNWTEELPDGADSKALGTHIARRMNYLDAQDDFERALTRIHTPPKR